MNSRRKGHDFERFCAELLRPYFPKARRQLEYHQNDCLGVDLADTGPFLFQCKKRAAYVSVQTITEIVPQPGKIPVLITAGDNLEPMVVLPFKHFLELL
jgi:hypothetical protein